MTQCNACGENFSYVHICLGVKARDAKAPPENVRTFYALRSEGLDTSTPRYFGQFVPEGHWYPLTKKEFNEAKRYNPLGGCWWVGEDTTSPLIVGAEAMTATEVLKGNKLADEVITQHTAHIAARITQTAGDHYTKMLVQPWDVVDTWPLEQRIGFYRGNALKYIMRMGSKDENSQEIAKGKHYLEKLLEVLGEATKGEK